MPLVDLGIDLGSSQMVIATRHRGVVLREPSVLATDTELSHIFAYGTEAFDMFGRTPASITLSQPIRKGVISHYDHAEKLVQHYIDKVCAFRIVRPRVALSVPSFATRMELRTAVKAVSSCGVRQIRLVEESVASAIGAGLPVMEAHGSMAVNLGGGSVNIALLSLGCIVASHSIRMGGDMMDDAVIRNVRNQYHHVIGIKTAQQLRNAVGCFYSRAASGVLQVGGRDTHTGLPRRKSIPFSVIYDALEDIIRHIVDAVVTVLEAAPPELSGDICGHGIVLAGGLAQMRGLDLRLSEELGVDCRVAPEPGDCVALGTLRAANYMKELHNEMPDGREKTDGEWIP